MRRAVRFTLVHVFTLRDGRQITTERKHRHAKLLLCIYVTLFFYVNRRFSAFSFSFFVFFFLVPSPFEFVDHRFEIPSPRRSTFRQSNTLSSVGIHLCPSEFDSLSFSFYLSFFTENTTHVHTARRSSFWSRQYSLKRGEKKVLINTCSFKDSQMCAPTFSFFFFHKH